MKRKKLLIVWLATLACIGIPVASAPQADETVVTAVNAPEVLKGVKAMYVVVGHTDPDAQKAGLTQAILQTDVERKLREAGIRLLSHEDLLHQDVFPTILHVNVRTYKSANELFAFHIAVDVQEGVSLQRDPKHIVLGATTWSRDSLGTVGSANLATVRDDVRTGVDQFLDDYLKANPK